MPPEVLRLAIGLAVPLVFLIGLSVTAVIRRPVPYPQPDGGLRCRLSGWGTLAGVAWVLALPLGLTEVVVAFAGGVERMARWGWLVLGLCALPAVALAVYAVVRYRNYYVEYGPDAVSERDWRGRLTTIPHDEITEVARNMVPDADRRDGEYEAGWRIAGLDGACIIPAPSIPIWPLRDQFPRLFETDRSMIGRISHRSYSTVYDDDELEA